MSGASLPFLRLSGSPREIGEAHGRIAADLVAHNLEVYFRRFAGEVALSRDEVLRRTELYWPSVRACSHAFAEMVEGIAQGAGLPVLEVAAINLRFEWLYGDLARIGAADPRGFPAPSGECTAFAVTPEASSDGHLWMGQNWDWIPEVAGIVHHITLADGLRVLCLGEAGIAGGKIGLNSAGIGLAVNGLLSSDDDWSRRGRPFHLRTWEILCSPTLGRAIEAATGPLHSCSANFLIGAALPTGVGTAVSIETAPRGACVHDPAAGILVHANHFRDPDRLGVRQPIPPEEWRFSCHRHARMERLIADLTSAGRIGSDRLQAILRDHDGHPESICQHPNPELPEAERDATVASIVMDLHEGSMQVAAGPPCSYAYRSYRV